MMTKAAEIVANYGYKEININVGCPSSRVSTLGTRAMYLGGFGASLMKDPERVRDIVSSIIRRVDLPVTVKTRTGVDDSDSDEFLNNFIRVKDN